MLRSSICEFLRRLVHCNCVNFNQAALRVVLKPENISASSQATNVHTLRLCVSFKYASFYRRLQSFQSLLGSLFLLVSIVVWLQNTWALELNYFVFETFYLLPFWHPCMHESPFSLQGPFDYIYICAMRVDTM